MTTAGGARSRAAASAAPGISCERSSFDAIWDEWEAEAARASPAAPVKPRGVMSAAALALLPSPGRRAARSSPGRGAAQAAPGEIVELVRSQTERFFEHLRSEASALRAENAQLREAAAAAAATKEALQRAPVPHAHARRITAAAVAEETTVMQPRSNNAGDLETGTPRWHDPCGGPWYDGAPLATALPPSRVIRSSAAASQGDTVSHHSGAFTAHIAGIGRRSPRPAAACDDVDAAERGSAPGSARSDVSWGGEGDAGGDVSDGGDSARSGGAARGAAMRVCRAAAASCGASMEALSALLHLRSGDHDGDLVTGGGDYDGRDDYNCGIITMAAAPQPQPRAWAQAARAASPVHRHAGRASLAVVDDDVAGDDSCVSLASLRALRIGAVAAAEAACADAQEALRRGAPPPPRAPHAPGAAAAAEAAAEAVREASDTFAARADDAAVRYNNTGQDDASPATSSGVRRGALPRPAAWPFAARGIEVQAAGASEAVTQLNPSSSSAPAADVAPGLAFPRDYWDDVAAARALRALPSAVAEAEAADDDDDLDAESAPLSFAAALAAAAAAQSDATAAASAALARAAALCASSEALHAEAALDDGTSSCDDAAGGPTSNASVKGAVAQPVEARDADALRKAAAIIMS
jgi:hypothetical protein